MHVGEWFVTAVLAQACRNRPPNTRDRPVLPLRLPPPAVLPPSPAAIPATDGPVLARLAINQLLLRPSPALRNEVEQFTLKHLNFASGYNAVHLRQFGGGCPQWRVIGHEKRSYHPNVDQMSWQMRHPLPNVLSWSPFVSSPLVRMGNAASRWVGLQRTGSIRCSARW